MRPMLVLVLAMCATGGCGQSMLPSARGSGEGASGGGAGGAGGDVRIVQMDSPGAMRVCADDDDRVVVPVWMPEVDANDGLSSDPPRRDGRVVFIRLQETPQVQGTEEDPCNAQALHSFSRPGNAELGYPQGMAVNLRGNVHAVDGGCRFEGYFVNEDGAGVQQGWLETYFRAVDEREVLRADRHCLERAID